MQRSKLVIVALILSAVAVFFWFDVHHYLRFEQLRAHQEAVETVFAEHPWQTALSYFAGYVIVTALSLPGAAVMTLAGGLILGLGWGTLIVSFASSIGATLAFLIARFLLRDWVQQRYGRHLKAINAGIEREGALYLFTLRLVPAFPFFLINLAMALTPMRSWTFYWVSQLGMLPGTLVFVNAGTQLARIESPGDILSPALIGSFALLGLFPLIAKKTVDFMHSRKALARFAKPKRFDRNLIVIGAGSGGLVSAYIAAAVKAKVSLIEKAKMGGDCLNTGCVPSKALIQSARLLAHARRADAFGLEPAELKFDFAKVMERVQRVVETVEPHDSIERYEGLGVEVIQGEARIASPWAVRVNGQELTTRGIIIATGARPFVPPIEGLKEAGYLTSENLWDLRELPARLVVLGGGPIGSELAQAFARFGSRVTQVEMGERLLSREDPEVSELVQRRFRAEGVDVRLRHKAKAVLHEHGEKSLLCEHAGEEVRIPFDQILVAVGRAPNTQGFGLEELGVPTTARGTLEVNDFLQTYYPTIYAVGDVAGPYQFTHTASHQAWFAAVNALFGSPLKRFRADYSVIPWATFIEPEVAHVGLNELEAKERGVAYEVTRYEMADLDRAIADEAAEGFIKVLTVPGKDKILGATLVGPHAGELIGEYVTAMRHGLGMNKILSTIHIYPTLAEANKFAAGEWKRAHAPAGVLRWLERFHRWRRGSGEDRRTALFRDSL